MIPAADDFGTIGARLKALEAERLAPLQAPAVMIVGDIETAMVAEIARTDCASAVTVCETSASA